MAITVEKYSVFDNQFYDVSYTDNSQFLQTFANIAAVNINAYTDTSTNVNQSLLLGATSNINFEAFDTANMYTYGGFNMFHKVVNDPNDPKQILNINLDPSQPLAVIDSTAGNNNMCFTFSNQINLNSFNIVSSRVNSSYDTIYSTKANGIYVASPVVFNSNVTFEKNITTNGSIFGSNLNVWCNRTAQSSTDIAQIGYGFRVNTKNELELIKMATFGPNSNNLTSQRIAVFGQGAITSGNSDNSAYLAFNSLNGLTINDGNGQVVQASSSLLDSYIYVNPTNGYIGIGVQSASYNLQVVGTGQYSGLLTTTGGISTSTIVPITDQIYDLGSATKYFNNIFAKKLYIGPIGITQGTRGMKFVDSTNTVQSIQCSSIYFGPDASPVLIERVNENIRFIDVNSQTTLNISGADLSTFATQADNNNLYNLVTGGNYSWDINMNTHTLSNVGGLEGNNASFSNIYVTNQVFTAGSDFAEFLPKANVSDTFATGEVVGLNFSGAVTRSWSDAIHYMVVSSSPGLVGGGNSDSSSSDSLQMIGFCGRVPIICPGAQVGDYIIPVPSSDGGISCQAISQTNVTFNNYFISVGRVISVDPSGTPTIILKPA